MEFRLLEFMARNAGQVLSRQLIFEKVWDYFGPRRQPHKRACGAPAAEA